MYVPEHHNLSRHQLISLNFSSEVGVVTPIIPSKYSLSWVVATHGILTSSSFWLTEKSEKDWEYFRVSGSMNPRFVPDGHGHAELVILVSLFR